jgi:hypothetical protein
MVAANRHFQMPTYTTHATVGFEYFWSHQNCKLADDSLVDNVKDNVSQSI